MKNATDITIVLDRSGSMASIRSDMEEGINSFIEEQKNISGECIVSLLQFDDVGEWVFSNKLLADVPRISLVPRGRTALLDAIGGAISAVGARLSFLSEDQRPDKVLFVIITDGYENASRECSAVAVKDMVEHQEKKYFWQFVYLGANQDSVKVAAHLGMRAAGNYVASSVGVAGMSARLTRSVSNYRGTTGGRSFTLYNYLADSEVK